MTFLLSTILLTGLISNGFSLITQKGKIGYFIRKPIDRLYDKLGREKNNRIQTDKDKTKSDIEKMGIEIDKLIPKDVQRKHNMIIDGHEIFEKHVEREYERSCKKIDLRFDWWIGCLTCMASFWGTLTYWSCFYLYAPEMSLNGMWMNWIMCVLASAYFNTWLNNRL